MAFLRRRIFFYYLFKTIAINSTLYILNPTVVFIFLCLHIISRCTTSSCTRHEILRAPASGSRPGYVGDLNFPSTSWNALSGPTDPNRTRKGARSSDCGLRFRASHKQTGIFFNIFFFHENLHQQFIADFDTRLRPVKLRRYRLTTRVFIDFSCCHNTLFRIRPPDRCRYSSRCGS